MTRVFLTGATGFVGGHIAEVLLAKDYEVRALVRPGQTLPLQHGNLSLAEGDVRDRDSLKAAVAGCDSVIHTAALYAFWLKNPGLMYDVNVEGTRNVLQASVNAGVERIVYTSTVGALTPRTDRLTTEEDFASPGELVGDYKRSKWEAERVALRFADAGAPVVIVSPTAPVGPADVKPTPTGNIILRFLRRKMPALVETGLNFVHVRDVADGHLLAMESGIPGQRYLLGNTCGNLTLSEALSKLSAMTGLRAPRCKLPHLPVLAFAYADTFLEGRLLHREPMAPVEAVKVSMKKMWVDPSKAVRELGLPQRPVESALQEAVDWFTGNGYVANRPQKSMVQE